MGGNDFQPCTLLWYLSLTELVFVADEEIHLLECIGPREREQKRKMHGVKAGSGLWSFRKMTMGTGDLGCTCGRGL